MFTEKEMELFIEHLECKALEYFKKSQDQNGQFKTYSLGYADSFLACKDFIEDMIQQKKENR